MIRWGAFFLIGLLGVLNHAAAADPVPSQASSPAARAIESLLNAEITPGKTRLESVMPLYEQARAVAPHDARLEYAYSLVLHRLFQSTEAREHLQRALAIDPAFAPANQAIIRDLLKTRQFTDAGERISGFAARLDEGRPGSAEVAEWLGRVVAAVIVAIGTSDAQVQFAYQDRMLRLSLPPVLRSRYERGFGNVELELEQLSELIDVAQTTAETKRDVAKAKVDADLLKDQQEIKVKLQDAQKSREKWDEWITDQTAKADEILKEQEKRYQDLDRAAVTQLQAVNSLRLAMSTAENGALVMQQQVQNQQLQQLRQPQQQTQQLLPQRPRSQQQSPQSQPGVVTTTGPIFAGAMASTGTIGLQLMVEERRLGAIYDQQAAVANAASRTLATRKQAIAQYQQATGVVMKESANLDRWEKRNKSIAENQKKAAEKKPAQVATLEAKIKSLSTWDPADFETEKRRLLADLGITPK
ncbi:MAG TPA: hypothetical protein VM510_00850 [Caulifigura sp.]|nr:hypothetical protein [Caulifigura sp.]